MRFREGQHQQLDPSREPVWHTNARLAWVPNGPSCMRHDNDDTTDVLVELRDLALLSPFIILKLGTCNAWYLHRIQPPNRSLLYQKRASISPFFYWACARERESDRLEIPGGSNRLIVCSVHRRLTQLVGLVIGSCELYCDLDNWHGAISINGIDLVGPRPRS